MTNNPNDTKVTLTLAGGKEIFSGTDKEFDDACDKINAAPEKQFYGKGHNRVGGVAVDQLRTIVSRIERLEVEKAERGQDIREVYGEAKGNGFDVKAIRKIIMLRRKDAAERDEEEAVLDLYMRALGMKPQLDLFDDKGQGDE